MAFTQPRIKFKTNRQLLYFEMKTSPLSRFLNTIMVQREFTTLGISVNTNMSVKPRGNLGNPGYPFNP